MTADSQGLPAVAPLYDISTIFHFADKPQPNPENRAVGLIVHLTLSAGFGERAGAELQQRRIGSLEEAERVRFLGSPTVRVNGRDVDPGASARTDYALTCRIYRSDELGRSPQPPEQWIRAALEAARA